MNIFEFILPCLAAFLACIGFSFLYNLRRKYFWLASLCGAFAWAVYLVADIFTASQVLPYFISALAIAFYSEIAAYLFHALITVYLIPGIIPLVPGLTIYRTMKLFLSGDLSSFAAGLLETLKIGGAIVLGLILMSTFFRILRNGIRQFRRSLRTK